MAATTLQEKQLRERAAEQALKMAALDIIWLQQTQGAVTAGMLWK